MRSAALLAWVGRLTITLVLVAIAAVAGEWLWVYYQVEPWTRDGRIRVDVADIAPDVSGLVTEVDVVDNMPIHKGQQLFVIDRPRYEFALRQAEAALQQATAGLQQAEAGVQVQNALLAQARRVDVRNHKLGTLVPTETVEEGAARVAQLEAAVAQAEATVSQARAALAQAAAARDIARLIWSGPGSWRRWMASPRMSISNPASISPRAMRLSASPTQPPCMSTDISRKPSSQTFTSAIASPCG